ncbi:MAG: PHP domain-containing protein, partial [Oscillospiraceae bacterium]|nr:PHP domain-containing protein [Oscillospiraceae bacterium]
MFTNKLELAYSNELHDYDIFPKVIPAGKRSKITIKPLGSHAAFEGVYQLSVHPLDEGQPSQYPDRPNRFQFETEAGEDGCIRFAFDFFGEQEYYIRLAQERTNRPFKLQLSVYSVFEDLIGRYPFRGNLHLHTHRSDGTQGPEIMAANYRKTGLDFLAITDHCRYAPSLEAIEAYKQAPIEMCLLTGEEVHVPCDNGEGEERRHLNNVHIVHVGGDYGINALVYGGEHGETDVTRRAVIPNPPPVRSKQAHWAEIDAHMQTMDIPERIKGRERYLIASCHWVYEEIRRAGGLGIFAHPYWLSNVISIPPDLQDYIMESQHFDAFEVLGGDAFFSMNGFQMARYCEDREKGRRYPIVGSTDTHDSINNRDAYVASTLVFSPENKRRALLDSIKNFYSVAVDTIDETPRFVGDFRLVRYASFLTD